MVYTTIAPRKKVQEIIINNMEIVSGNNQNRNKELLSSNQLEYLIDEWGRRRRRIGDGVIRSNRRALFSTEWEEEKREIDKTELEINADDDGEYDCHHLDFCISFTVFFRSFLLRINCRRKSYDGHVPIFENSPHFNLHALNQK